MVSHGPFDRRRMGLCANRASSWPFSKLMACACVVPAWVKIVAEVEF